MARSSSILDPALLGPAVGGAFRKLDPRALYTNPVMFTVEVVAALVTVLFLRDLATGAGGIGFSAQIIVWLWFTVLFANFAEAVAEGRGKAQADDLRKTRTETQAKLLRGRDRSNYEMVAGTAPLRSTTWCWSRPATPFPPTARWWKASPASTRRRSPANPPP